MFAHSVPERSAHSLVGFVGRSLGPVLAAFALLLSGFAARADNVHGAWDSQLYPWPLIPLHAVLTPDMRVMTYGTDGTGKQTGYFIYDVWDINSGFAAGHLTLDNVTQTDLFCSSQVVLPQGNQVFLAGGDNWTGTKTTNTGNNNTNLFTIATNTLARGNNLNRPRWYSSSTVLLNGEILVQGGRGGTDLPEVRQANGTFRLLTGAATGALNEQYPRNYIAPDGRVFGYDVLGRMYYLNPTGTGSITTVGQFEWNYRGVDSTTAMFRPGRILQFGGNSRGAIVIDITDGGTPVITKTQPLSFARRLGTGTILPDGKVLATGGSSAYNQLTNVAYAPEIWDPTTGTWTLGPPGQRSRLYHSMALLLPDGRVMVGGGGAPGPETNTNVEIYNPPYLYDSAGQRAIQPTLSNVPAQIDVGETFFADFNNASEIRRVTLVKTGSVTHGFNMEQRFVELTFEQSGSRLRIQAPTKASEAPPGFWMLFAINAQGVPSRGRIMKVNIATNWNPAISPTLTNPGDRTGRVAQSTSLQLVATDPNGDVLGYGASGLPPGLTLNEQTGLISGTPTAAGTYDVVVAASDGVNDATQSFVWIITDPAPLDVEAPPQPAPKLAGSSITYTAGATNAINPRFRWQFDADAPTAWSTSATITHTFGDPGVHYVTVTVTDDRGVERTETVVQLIHLPLTTNRPTASTNIATETRAGASARVWVVNQDNNSVSVLDAVTAQKTAEITVGSAPRSLAIANGEVWVTNKFGASITVIDAASLAVSRTIAMPRASQPFGIAFAPGGAVAYVTLEATGKLVKLDATSHAIVGTVDVGPNPRQLSISASGQKIFVSRFVTRPLSGEGTAVVQTSGAGGDVVVVDAETLDVARTIKLAHSNKPDFESQGRGIPNYLGAAVISPDGTQAWVPSKQDNIVRGTLRDGSNLDFQNTVRAISSRIDLATSAETLSRRIDHDNASLASAAAFNSNGVYLFVALETSREIAVLDAHGGWQIFRIDVGRAPQGLTLAGNRLFVNNFMDRTVSVLDLSGLLNTGSTAAPLIATPKVIGTERLTAQVLKGKQFFYDARDPRLSRDRYLSCATCHSDGGSDGRVWDLTGLGEGLRNTSNLRGRGGMSHGFLHWSGNFDEVQDFEGQIRALSGGTGLMSNTAFTALTRSQPLGTAKAGVSADLDALAAYVASLTSFQPSPARNADGTLTSDAVRGRTVFETAGCGTCHGGSRFTNSGNATLMNIGTIKPSSGTRLNGTLTGIDPPTLRDAWATAPYLHDGSASTIEAAITAHTSIALSSADLAAVSTYVRQIGSDEPSAPGVGTGLKGQYFANATLSGTPVLTRTETINFSWGTGSPATAVPADNFSVRWSGEIRAPSTGTYYFKSTTDDGVRVTVNGVRLIDNWLTHELMTASSKAITLTAGVKYSIRVEYFESTGSATAKLSWRTPANSVYQTVPRDLLYAN